MKSLYICGLFALAFIQSRAQSSPSNRPAIYVDGVRADASLNYINPVYIESLNVIKDGGNGTLQVHMKAGHTLASVTDIARDTIGSPMQPTIYIVNGHIIPQPDSLLLDKGDIHDIKLVRTTDIPSVKDLPGPMAIILINLGVKPPSKEKTINIRG
jgi:hypothetical protein